MSFTQPSFFSRLFKSSYFWGSLLIISGLLFWISGLDYTIQFWIEAQDTQSKNTFWRIISLFALGKIQLLACLAILFFFMHKTLSLPSFILQILKNIILTYGRFFKGAAQIPPLLKNYPLRVQQLFMAMPLMLFVGTLCALLKIIIGRPRPKMFLWHDDVTMQWLNGFSGKFQSMPSGHTITTVVLVTALWPYFPKLRWPLLIYTFISALARVMSMTTHYTSDVLVAAGLGIIATTIFSQQYNKRN